MVFSSATFLFIMLPLFLLTTLLVRKTSAANVLLLIISLVFYAWGEPVYVLLMIGSVLCNYLLALPAQRAQAQPRLKKAMLWVSVLFNIGLLGVFKYAGFAVQTVSALSGIELPIPNIELPIGISFFTFQTMSYVIDAYMGRVAVQKNYFKLLLYVSFFPQLIAGPIVRYKDIESRLDSREVTIERAAQGLQRFIVGLSKKLLIANTVGSMVDTIYNCDSQQLTLPLAWLAAVCYCLQIYFDFSGYSDMAIGLGKVAGFDFAENFNYPFTAASMQDFWHRWHISLSTWFREYVYIPLGGNRKGKVRTGLNRLAVFFLTGLWHGAQWTFVAWGLLHGAFLMLETYGVIRPERWRIKPLRHIYTLLVVCVTFVVFRAESFTQAFDMLGAMFAGPLQTAVGNIRLSALMTAYNITIIAIAFIASTPILGKVRARLGESRAQQTGYVTTAVLAVLCMLALSGASYNPFIYFRF